MVLVPAALQQFVYLAGEQIGRILAGRRSGKRCIVLDCDNTLWGGIIGGPVSMASYLAPNIPARHSVTFNGCC